VDLAQQVPRTTCGVVAVPTQPGPLVDAKASDDTGVSLSKNASHEPERPNGSMTRFPCELHEAECEPHR